MSSDPSFHGGMMTRKGHPNPRMILYRLSRFSKHRPSRGDGVRTHREKVLQDSVIVCCSTENCGPEGGYFTETPDSDDSMVGHTAFSRLDPVRKISLNAGSWCLTRYKEYLFLDNKINKSCKEERSELKKKKRSLKPFSMYKVWIPWLD